VLAGITAIALLGGASVIIAANTTASSNGNSPEVVATSTASHSTDARPRDKAVPLASDPPVPDYSSAQCDFSIWQQLGSMPDSSNERDSLEEKARKCHEMMSNVAITLVDFTDMNETEAANFSKFVRKDLKKRTGGTVTAGEVRYVKASDEAVDALAEYTEPDNCVPRSKGVTDITMETMQQEVDGSDKVVNLMKLGNCGGGGVKGWTYLGGSGIVLLNEEYRLSLSHELAHTLGLAHVSGSSLNFRGSSSIHLDGKDNDRVFNEFDGYDNLMDRGGGAGRGLNLVQRYWLEGYGRALGEPTSVKTIDLKPGDSTKLTAKTAESTIVSITLDTPVSMAIATVSPSVSIEGKEFNQLFVVADFDGVEKTRVDSFIIYLGDAKRGALLNLSSVSTDDDTAKTIKVDEKTIKIKLVVDDDNNAEAKISVSDAKK